MKTFATFVLLFAAALAASAQLPSYEPLWGAQYGCHYSNYAGPATSPDGWANWVIRVRTSDSLIWAIENFQATNSFGHDNHSVAWARLQQTSYYTIWEFTDGTVQCKNTMIYWGRKTIDFQNCNDGHSRVCHLQ